MIKEKAIRHEITGVEDDGRQHVEEEGRRRQRRHAGAVGVEEQQADDDTNDDEKTRFREDGRQLWRHMETYPKTIQNKLIHVSVK